MACARYSDALSEVAAGGPLPQGFNAHLHGCLHCQRELELRRRVLTVADQDMRQLATSEPSAGFVARVRAMAMESGSAPTWRAGWVWPSLATAATLVVALIVIFSNRSADETIAASQRQPFVPATAPAPQPAREPDRTPAVAGTSENHRATPPLQRRTSRRRVPAEPQVLVPPGESRVLVEFIALVNRERLLPATLAMAGKSLAPLAAPAPIVIKPIEIVPLDPATYPGT